MTRLIVPRLLIAVVTASGCLFADNQKPQTVISSPPITTEGRYALVRELNAEHIFIRKTFPRGTKGLTLKDGVVGPSDEQMKMLLANNGPAARVGERAQITAINIHEKSVTFEINGGPKKHKKWYKRLSVESTGGSTPLVPDNSDSENAKGSFVEVQFDRYVPDIPPAEFKKLLAPVFDFSAISATQAYADALPPKTKAAVKSHQVLVGMNHEMVIASKGRPDEKIREHDVQGDYEEWMYGQPPQEVQFIRFRGDEVAQVKVMTVDGQKIVRTEREVDTPAVSAQAQPVQAPAAPATRPSLRRPGEEVPQLEPSATPRPGMDPRTGPAQGPDPSAPQPPVTDSPPHLSSPSL